MALKGAAPPHTEDPAPWLLVSAGTCWQNSRKHENNIPGFGVLWSAWFEPDQAVCKQHAASMAKAG